MRSFNAKLLAPILKLTGFRFSKAFRYGITTAHKLAFAAIDTVYANHLADK